MWHANTVNFCNNELKQRILSGRLLESGILLQPNSSKANFTVLNKKCMKWKRNRSLFEKNFFEFLCRFYRSKILFNSNVHADSRFYVSLYKYVSIFWINNDFAWFFAFFQSSDYVCSHEQKKCINISTSFFCLLGRSNAKILFFAS